MSGIDPRLSALLGAARDDPERTAILLDLDGTLAPIVEHPEDVEIPQTLRALLPHLRDRYRMLGFISGRALDELRRIVGVSGVAYSGNHGMEMMLPGGSVDPAPSVDLARLRGFASRWPASTLNRAGIWLEDKGATLTFHYRTAPDPQLARDLLARDVAPAAAAAGLRAAPGRMSLEVHPAGDVSKGTAAATLLRAAPEVRHVVSIGDDRTDTDVWRALRRMVAADELIDGVGIGVASDETPDEVRESADALVTGIDGTQRVIEHLLARHPD